MHYDIVIAGGGLVGTTLALALQHSSWRVALIDSYSPTLHQQATADNRTLALSYSSQKIFDALGVWQSLSLHATPIEKIHVSEEKRFGKTLLDANALTLPPFAQVIPISFLYQILQAHLKTIIVLRPATVTHLSKENQHWELIIHDKIHNIHKKIQSTFLVAADGEQSFIRDTLQLPLEITDYHQTAIVTSSQISLPHQNTAYERFTSKGVLAMLPLPENRAATIWTAPSENIPYLTENLMTATQSVMGYRLGKISRATPIQTYPLKALQSQTQALPGFCLLGHSAHVLHPIAAQGLNLSLRDAITLAELLQETKDLTDPSISTRYINSRKADQHQTAQFTDKLVKLFSSSFLPFSLFRTLGLSIFDLFPTAKRAFCLKRMGLTNNF